MSYRNFRDPANGRWDVWLVLPAAAERGKEERRAASAASAAAYTGIERRTTPSRRRISFSLGSAVQRGYEIGWLVSRASRERSAAWYPFLTHGKELALNSFGVGARLELGS